jgi:PEP-CTERM motif
MNSFRSLMRLVVGPAVVVAAGLSITPAKADLVLESTQLQQGQGLGAQFTVLTLQGQGTATTESGGVLFNGNVFGDAGSGASQSRTFTFSDLGISSASQLGLVVNLSEPGSENPPSVTTANSTLASNANLANTITLNVYDASGNLIQQHLASAQTFTQVASGLGGSGLVFGLTSTEQTALDAIIASTPGTERFTVGATFANAQGGQDAIQAVRLTAAIPEPATWAMMLLGFAAVGFTAYRRKSHWSSVRIV